MLTLQRPSEEKARQFLDSRALLDFSYRAIGATRTIPPAGYALGHLRINLGQGEKVFRAAKGALDRWDHFRLGWLQIYPAQAPVRTGQAVAVLARFLGLWWLNACRIVYVIDEENEFGFAYGTLPSHAVTGEERFRVELDRQTGDVFYDILAFSRPRHFLTWLGYPLFRRMQKRFRAESAVAMRRAI
jgi:uncharacterized protein (UPF0548 family)